MFLNPLYLWPSNFLNNQENLFQIQDLITTSDRASNRTTECHLDLMEEEEEGSAQVSTHREATTHQDIFIMEAETTHTIHTER